MAQLRDVQVLLGGFLALLAVAALALIVPLALLIANLLAAPPGQRAARLPIGQVLRAE
ncbi:MAG: hypothetical protein ACRDRP_25300 [Pseudonocardiaceae bacterium]